VAGLLLRESETENVTHILPQRADGQQAISLCLPRFFLLLGVICKKRFGPRLNHAISIALGADIEAF
jgi:hypothetical protein